MKFNTKQLSVLALLSAYGANAFAAAIGANVTGFFGNMVATLATGVIPIAVITVAFCYVGYQVAFGGKRVADMFPVIIGSVIIGAAGQLATFLFTP